MKDKIFNFIMDLLQLLVGISMGLTLLLFFVKLAIWIWSMDFGVIK